MPLYRVRYISRTPQVRGLLRDKFVGEILKRARENNERAGITGMLVYVGDYFLQILEGRRGALSEVMAKVMSDDRHAEVTIVSAEPITKRRFDDRMACFALEEATTPLLRRFTVFNDFDPFELTPSALGELFEELQQASKPASQPGDKKAA